MHKPSTRTRSAVLVLGVAFGLCLGDPGVGAVTRIEWLGQARIPGGTSVDGAPVGGLSGITFDAQQSVFYVVVDDPSARGPARFFTVAIDLSRGSLTDESVDVRGMTVIQDPAGGPIQKLTVDPEGIALHPDRSLYISSEGQMKRQAAPFLRRYSLQGEYLADLPLAPRYQPTADGSGGPRHNMVFESLTVTPDGRYLFSALENALIQDGPVAALDVPSPSRLLQYDLGEGRLVSEYVYMTEPLAVPSSVPDGVEVNGLVDILALDQENLLSLERSFSMGVGNTIKLFQVRIAGASDVQGYESLAEASADLVTPVAKELLLNLGELGVYLDNLEGMTLGPVLEDGRQTLILVSDDNFDPLVQTTQIFAFAIGDATMDVEWVQGADHRSPLHEQWVLGVEGVVTGVLPDRQGGFWIESPTGDEDVATSRGVLISPPPEGLAVSPGEALRIDGRVLEIQRPGELSVTTIRPTRVVSIDSGGSLDPAVLLGAGGRAVPGEVVDDDGMSVFEPRFDGLDFWESLEGMRVELADARVIGPTTRYGELTIDASGGRDRSGHTSPGGLSLRPGDLNPERLVVDLVGPERPPTADVGDRFAGPLIGIVGYRFGRYRLYVQDPLPPLIRADLRSEVTSLRGDKGALTIATFNTMNLSAVSDNDRFRSVARTLDQALGAPDIVGLQEIQDDSGPQDDGIVTASLTLERLIGAIVERGGPRYAYRQLDPVNKGDGGQPGSNIRVAFLFNPDRVDFVDRGRPGPEVAVRVTSGSAGPALSVSPGRIEPAAPAFSGDEARGFSASRKPLVGEFRFRSESIFIVNNHFCSKSADTRVFGDLQPQIRHSEDQRSQQAKWVGEFVAEILQLDPSAGIVVLGDLNDHEFRPPLRILTASGLVDLSGQLSPEDRYTFNYWGNSQVLDHILVNQSLLERAHAEVDVVHANADFAHERRSSDHDPVLLRLEFAEVD